MAKKRSKGPTMRIDLQRMSVEKLKPAPFNPRTKLRPGDPAYRKIKRSIQTFGFVDALVWNKRSGYLLGGNQRLEILVAEFEVTEIDVSVVDLDPTAERALCVALNKITGEWDEAALVTLLREVEATADATTTGFDPEELESLYARSQIRTEIKDIEVKKPPAMGWVLIGIPLVRYGEISDMVARMASVDGIVLETTIGNA